MIKLSLNDISLAGLLILPEISLTPPEVPILLQIWDFLRHQLFDHWGATAPLLRYCFKGNPYLMLFSLQFSLANFFNGHIDGGRAILLCYIMIYA